MKSAIRRLSKILPLFLLVTLLLTIFLTPTGCFKNRAKKRRQDFTTRRFEGKPERQPSPKESSKEPNVEGFSKEVTYNSDALALKAYLCKPEGKGPFSAVVYNHGGLRGQIGGAPSETCEALKDSGFVGFSPIRRDEVSMSGNLNDVLAALDYVKSLSYVDGKRLGVMGFSRGGILTFMAATKTPELKAVVIMASAPAPGDYFQTNASKFRAPALLLVATNDTPSKYNKHQNLVEVMKKMNEDLKSAGKDVELIIYPPYKDTGHLMFFEVGDYWKDVEKFLQRHLK